MKKLFSHIIFISALTCSNYMNAMFNSKAASMASSKISTAARRAISSHPKYKSADSLKTYTIDGAKGVIGGSIGAGIGLIAGGSAAIITGLIVAPPCHLANIDVDVKEIESFTSPAFVATGGLIGSAAAGGVPGVAAYGALLATAYAVGKYKAQHNIVNQNSKK
ncbi:hypothetical protein [Candidatus Chromulinivorax destructor]|uniref:Uncharacterized protein n=1 Tax=Candidatus Chromulinivorax destructor TaxID=2066483 RepID=A0A345ZCP7_9BACT|nr:hypothetical protein [Candidatus Chromulinivorax destructor]AXK61064.1 hypothetical protein C0J27_05015 [Candidatus Chromulinivorax destructor]